MIPNPDLNAVTTTNGNFQDAVKQKLVNSHPSLPAAQQVHRNKNISRTFKDELTVSSNFRTNDQITKTPTNKCIEEVDCNLEQS